ncbi:permease prefix domain 1-containing protein [Anaerotignum sp.]
MEEKKWESYLNEVLSFVKFKYDHRAIRRELAEHMEDLREDLMAEGMDEAAAEYMTVAYMGDAAEIGKALDKEHGALLGWIWRITRALVILLALVTILPLLNLFTGVVGNYFEEYEPQSESAEAWHIELDREYQVYDYTLILEDVYYYADGTMSVVYRTKYNPFAKTILWGSSITVSVFDESGEEISCGGSGYKKGGWNGIGWQNLRDVPQDAKWLEIYYFPDLTVTVDLETGEVMDNEA